MLEGSLLKASRAKHAGKLHLNCQQIRDDCTGEAAVQEQGEAHAKPRPVPAVAFLTRSGRCLHMSLSSPDANVHPWQLSCFVHTQCCRCSEVVLVRTHSTLASCSGRRYHAAASGSGIQSHSSFVPWPLLAGPAGGKYLDVGDTLFLNRIRSCWPLRGARTCRQQRSLVWMMRRTGNHPARCRPPHVGVRMPQGDHLDYRCSRC
jgi:hypothetical protein